MGYDVRSLFSASARNTNSLTAAKAEAVTAGAGWTIGAGITSAAASSTPGPYGYSVGTLVTTAAAGSRLIHVLSGATVSTGGCTVTMWLRQLTLNGIQIGVNDGTTTDQATFLTDSTGSFPVSVQPASGIARKHSFQFRDNTWILVQVSLMPSTTGLSGAGNGDIYITPGTASKTIEIWGVKYTQNEKGVFNGDGSTTEFTTPFTFTQNDTILATVDGVLTTVVADRGNRVRFATAPASGTNNVVIAKMPAVPDPYLTGLGLGISGDQYGTGWEPPLFRPSVGTGKLVTELKLGGSGPVASMKIQARMEPNAPWVDVGSAYDETAIGNGLLVVTDGYPEARVIPTVFGTSSTAQLSAWMAE